MPRKWTEDDAYFGEYQTILFELPTEDPPTNWILVNGEPITVNGEPVTVGE